MNAVLNALPLPSIENKHIGWQHFSTLLWHMFDRNHLMLRDDCGILNYKGVVVPKMKIEDKHHMPDLMVASGMTSVVVGSAQTTCYRRTAMGKALLATQSSTN